jgi:hypothetical protein
MAFTIQKEAADAAAVATDDPGAGERSFSLSAEPIVAPSATRDEAATSTPELPRNYGTQLLCLLPRDPRTIYAYWDVDWENAFAGDPPRDRKVHLRVRSEDGAAEKTVAVEPMAGYCYVDVADGDASYSAELGYFQPADTWNLIASSEPVTTPPDAITAGPADFATVPFHLSFERMMDELRRAKQESAALTAMLNELRQRATSAADRATFTAGQQEVAAALELSASPAASTTPASAPANGERPRDLWSAAAAWSMPGFDATSPRGGFGGSSQA